MGCDPFNATAVERLIQTKSPRAKPLPILASLSARVERIAHVSPTARKLGEMFWPGPLTLILPKKDLPEVATSYLISVGVRIPLHEIASNLIALSGGLLLGTSANKTGHSPPFPHPPRKCFGGKHTTWGTS